MKLNTALIKVLVKAGLTYRKGDACGNEDGVVYKIKKNGNTAAEVPC